MACRPTDTETERDEVRERLAARETAGRVRPGPRSSGRLVRLRAWRHTGDVRSGGAPDATTTRTSWHLRARCASLLLDRSQKLKRVRPPGSTPSATVAERGSIR